MDGLIQDFRLAARQLRARPGFAAVVVLTLALGIGVNTAVFSLANWVMLRPVPGTTDPDHLVTVLIQDHRSGNGGTSYPNVRDLAAGVPALTGLAGETRDYPLPARVGAAAPILVNTLFVSSNYFDVLGVKLEVGRAFSPAEEADVRTTPVVVVSHDFWASALHRDATVIGSYVSTGGRPTRVVGVAPPGFHGSDLLATVDFWIPGSALRMLQGTTENRAYGLFFYLRGRLAAGATAAVAQAQVRSQIARLIAAYPDNKRWLADKSIVVPGIGTSPYAREKVGHTLTIVAAIALLVLLVACANVANLFLFRSVTRRQSVGVRRALGASTARIARAEIVESLILAAGGGIAALAITGWSIELFRGRLFSELSHDVATRLDWRVFAFGLLATVVTGVVAGLAPAWRASRTDIVGTLKLGPRSHSAERGKAQGVLATAQLSIALAVIVAATLLIQTVRNLESVDVGFDADRVVTIPVAPSLLGHVRREGQRMMLDAMERLRATAGIENVALGAYTPFSFTMGDELHVNGDSTSVTHAWASPEYFQVMGVPLIRGRTFTSAEEFDSAAHAIILSASAARRLFGNADPIGQIVVGASGIWTRVVGVVGDTRWASVTDEGNGPVVYVTFPSSVANGYFFVRTSLPPSQVQRVARSVMASIAPDTPLGDADRLRDAVRRSYAEQMLLSRLLATFAIIVVVLAAVGLFGVIASGVAQRTREIGIRMALGARVGQVMRMVLRRGVVLGAPGAVLGIGGAIGLSRLVRSQLFGIRPDDPMVYIAATLMLAAVVLVATWIPARRAAQIDPARTLRSE